MKVQIIEIKQQRSRSYERRQFGSRDRLTQCHESRQSRSPDHPHGYDRDRRRSCHDDSPNRRHSRECYHKQRTPSRSNSRDRRGSLEHKVRLNSDKQMRCFTCGNYGHYTKGCAMNSGDESKELILSLMGSNDRTIKRPLSILICRIALLSWITTIILIPCFLLVTLR